MKDFSLSKVIGEVVKYIIILLFVVQAHNVIKLDVLPVSGRSNNSIPSIGYQCFIIMGVALFFATWLESIMRKKYPNATLTTLIVKYAIIIIAVFMTLIQLDIASSIVNAAFIIILGAIAIALPLPLEWEDVNLQLRQWKN